MLSCLSDMADKKRIIANSFRNMRKRYEKDFDCNDIAPRKRESVVFEEGKFST